jgi:uncharacterized protein YjiS (DUF1127 family)
MRTLLDRGSALPSAPLALWPRLAEGWTQMLYSLARARDRRNQFYRLEQLDDRMLKDIGLTRVDVRREARLAPWLG